LLEGLLFIFFSSFLYIRLPRGILFRIFAIVTYDLNHYVIWWRWILYRPIY